MTVTFSRDAAETVRGYLCDVMAESRRSGRPLGADQRLLDRYTAAIVALFEAPRSTESPREWSR